MPEIVVNTDNVQYTTTIGIGKRPLTKLPKTNLEKVEPPPGMNYNQTFEWELAMLLEGIAACYEPLPTWDLESIYVSCSKYLGWATRHAPDDQFFYQNWVSVEYMLNTQRRKLVTPLILFQTIMLNEKRRYPVSRPIYRKAHPKRATGKSRVSGQNLLLCKNLYKSISGPFYL